MPRKFIVLGQPRSGTTMVATGLAQHPNVRCYLELMHLQAQRRRENHWVSRAGRSIFDPPLYVVPDDHVVYQDGEDGAAFIRQYVFDRAWPPQIAAVGFKIHHVQGRASPGAFKVWPMLLADKDITVVRVERRNHLATLVSRLKAKASGRWHNWQTEAAAPSAVSTFELPADECAVHFVQQKQWYDWGRDVFREHRSIDLMYEDDLCGDYGGTLNRVFAMLGLPAHQIKPVTRKMEQHPLSSQIRNYAALAERFRDTPWNAYFQS